MLRCRVLVRRLGGLKEYHSLVRAAVYCRLKTSPSIRASDIRSHGCEWNGFLCSKSLLFERAHYLKTSGLANTKTFIETENSYAHQVLEEIPQYHGTLLTSSSDIEAVNTEEFRRLVNRDWNVEAPETLYRAFERISCYCSHNSYSISDAMFDNICHSMVAKCKEMTDSDLIGTLACLSKWPSAESLNSRNFCTLWSALDKECVQRHKQWDRNKLLYVADHWYSLHLSKVCEYMWHSIWRLGRKPSALSPAQLVQTMFYMNACRKIHPGVSMFEFEYSFEQCIDRLTIKEIGLVSMGFFKTQTKIRSSNLLYKILERLIQEADTVSGITLGAILKAIRYSLTPQLSDMLYQLLNLLVPRVDDLSLLSCIHIALAGTNVLVFHEGILKAISQRYSKAIEDVRVKDLERLSFVLTLFDYDPRTEPCIFRQIVKELSNPKRKEEFAKYPKCVPRCLYFLTITNIILDNLISEVLDHQFISKVYGKNYFVMDRELLCLDAIIEIERPQYGGNRLDPKLRSSLAKKYMVPVPTPRKSMTASNKMFLDVLDVLELVLGGKQYYYAGSVLPHFERPDIVFFMSSSGQPVAIPENLAETKVSAIKYAPSLPETGTWCCVVVGGWNTYVANTRKLLGSTASKIRHIAAVGYSPIFIPWYEWKDMRSPGTQDYLRRNIEAACMKPAAAEHLGELK